MPGIGAYDTIQFLNIEYIRRNGRPNGTRYMHYARFPSEKLKGEPFQLHIAVWEDHHGLKVGNGYCIHHLDHNPINNNIENLKCMSIEKHNRFHIRIRKLRKCFHNKQNNFFFGLENLKREIKDISIESGISIPIILDRIA